MAHGFPFTTPKAGDSDVPHIFPFSGNHRLTMKQQDAEFLFEPEYNWFQIFCRVEDAPKIKKTVRKSLEEIEKEVIGKDEFLINDDLALLVGFWSLSSLVFPRI